MFAVVKKNQNLVLMLVYKAKSCLTLQEINKSSRYNSCRFIQHEI